MSAAVNLKRQLGVVKGSRQKLPVEFRKKVQIMEDNWDWSLLRLDEVHIRGGMSERVLQMLGIVGYLFGSAPQAKRVNSWVVIAIFMWY